MTPEAQRIAIKEECGWMLDHINRYAMYYVPSMDCHVGDPLNDLNACREFWEILTQMPDIHVAGVGVCSAIEIYEDNLLEICDHPIRATAAQCCEAFLKTIGKWKNDARTTNRRPSRITRHGNRPPNQTNRSARKDR